MIRCIHVNYNSLILDGSLGILINAELFISIHDPLLLIINRAGTHCDYLWLGS